MSDAASADPPPSGTDGAPMPEAPTRRLSASEIVAKLLADPRLGLRLATQLPAGASPGSLPAIAEPRRPYPDGAGASEHPAETLAPGPIDPLAPTVEPFPDRPLRSLEYVVVDVETTGGSTKRGHRITEVAAIRVAWDGTLIDQYTSLVNPERPIPPFISALTNISWDMVRDAPTFPEIACDLARVLRGAVFVAHNAAFDWRFVSWELERATGVPPQAPRLCTVRLARKVVPEVASRSLDSLAYFFGLANLARHRAYGDARVTVDLLARLLQRVDEREIVSWFALEELLGRRKPRKPRRRQGMPTGMDPSDIPAQ